jgi:hypothetical protein
LHVRSGNFEAKFEAVRSAVETFGPQRDRHKRYYTFDVVHDRRARREWVEPDQR